jgi:ZIP family zinc transporter
MSTERIALLGALAGLTIFLGLPLGRLQSVDVRIRAALSAGATGILLFLLWDVLAHGVAPVEEALEDAAKEGGSWPSFVALALLFAGGMVAGLAGLVYYDRWIARARSKAMLGPGAASAAEFERPSPGLRLTSGQWLALLIATGIGLHNFGEGLAIGQSAAQGEISLALALIVGFGLHNATEGFGIVAPLSGEARRPSWGFLAILGLIGGVPTFAGTLVAQAFTSEYLAVAFFALAAGSILYVILELVNVNRSFGKKTLVTWALLAGLFLGFATDFVLEAVGG